MKIYFNCMVCDINCTRDIWEYNKNKNHFCSQKCAKIFRNRNIVHQAQLGDVNKYGIMFLDKFIKNKHTYYKCRCNCSNVFVLERSKFYTQKTCGKRSSHKGRFSRIFMGYEDISKTYWGSIIHGAKTRKLDFNITIQYAWKLFLEQRGLCALSHCKLNLSKNNNEEITASLDRIDSSKGYIEGNVQWIHKKLNIMKMNLSDKEFIDLCTQVANTHGLVTKLNFHDVFILPRKSEVNSRKDVDLYSEDNIIPIIASNLDTVGCFSIAKILCKFDLMTCLHKYYDANQYIDFLSTLDNKDKNKIFYSLGLSCNDFDKMLIVYEKTGIKNICLDVANAYIPKVLERINGIKNIIPNCCLMVGNIATPDTIEDFAKLKVDIVKCGIGSGGMCSTTLITGVGMPQLSCIIDCVQEANRYNIKVCSDGGCKEVGDICKAFGAGADFVMLGSMLAGHDECEGEWEKTLHYVYNGKTDGSEQYEEKEYKVFKFYGMSSKEAMEKHYGSMADYRASEGKCIKVPYRGPVKNTVQQILGGLRSYCSYIGASKLKDASKCTTFIKRK